MERWGSVLFIFLLFLSSNGKAVSIPERELWQFGMDYFELDPRQENGKIQDIMILKKYSLLELCGGSRYRFQREMLHIRDFLRDFGKEVYRNPSKIEFLRLSTERNKLLLTERASIDRFEKKKLNTQLSKIATLQGNLLTEIDAWKTRLAAVYKIIIRLQPEGNKLHRIQFIHPTRNFFENNKPGTSIYVQYRVK